MALVIWGAGSFLEAPRAFAADGPKPNACGCYRDTTGACFCGKKTKCGCPGECEPKGCEEKRAKQLEKEIAAETKKAASGKQSASGKGAKEKDSASEDGGGSEPQHKGKPLSAAQKKQLGKLLDGYLAEHPEGKSQTISEVRGTLGGK
ncbi:MAG TPA: hypothetical protein VGP07_18550 [Polyangia bacterium]|jgi:hypothetical protein